ncbi:MAG: hypothetical protein LBF41_08165, partial [Deltaproteobacteria bacterium]|nr:hypothetical protein [Deltaproteobacteria bacterium]
SPGIRKDRPRESVASRNKLYGTPKKACKAGFEVIYKNLARRKTLFAGGFINPWMPYGTF